jgi:predicted dehydrogenase
VSNDKTIRVAVIGAGAFGKNHARVYHDLQQAGKAVELVGIVDTDSNRAGTLAAQFGTKAFASLDQLLTAGTVDAASVAVPTTLHLRVAKAAMQAGLDVLIEKPIAASLGEADELVKTAKETGRVAQVGHLERFNPAVRATYPLINHPMFFEVHRLSVFGPRALDVDVVLDLMIHDLDIVLSFVDSPIREIRAVGLPILSPKVDIANVRIEFESGCVANLTASRVSTERVRKLRFFQPRQYISVDYTRQDLLVFSVSEQAGVEALARMQNAGGGPLSGAAILAGAGVSMSKPQVIPEEPLKAELQSFLGAVRARTTPVVSLTEGRTALRVALEVLQHIEEHSRRVGLVALGSIPAK